MDSLFSLELTGVWVVAILIFTYFRQRKLVLGLSGLLYIRYIMWRAFYTVPTDDTAGLVTGVALLLAEIYGTIQFGFFVFQTWNGMDRNEPIPTQPPMPPTPLTHIPTVDVFVTVVDEPLSILRQTLVGCLSMKYYDQKKVVVHVLDDGNREATRQLASVLGCSYHARRNLIPIHAKAGNLNYALSHSHGELVAIFDVDHVPTKEFLLHTVPHFHSPDVAIVQSTQHFYNRDIFQDHISHSIQNEQELFFSVLQPGRNAHNSAFFAGSGGVVRRSALASIGGFKTETITEDIHTSMELHAKGYRSVYVNMPLSAGLMPETFVGYVKQRKRWAIGCMQIFFKDNPLFKKGLSLAQRIDYLGSIFYFMFGFPRLIGLLAPLSILLFGVTPVSVDLFTLIVQFFGVYLVLMLSMHLTTSKMRNPFISDVYEVAMAPALCMAMIESLIPKKEREFEVTPKGDIVVQTTTFSQLKVATPHIVLFLSLLLGVIYGGYSMVFGKYDSGVPYAMFWASINLVMIVLAILTIREFQHRRKSHRHNINHRPIGVFVEVPKVVWLNEDRMEHSKPGLVYRMTECNLSLYGIGGNIPFKEMVPDVVIVHLFTWDSEQQLDVSFKSKVVRSKAHSDVVEFGLEFLPYDYKKEQQLNDMLFGNHHVWDDERYGVVEQNTLTEKLISYQTSDKNF